MKEKLWPTLHRWMQDKKKRNLLILFAFLWIALLFVTTLFPDTEEKNPTKTEGVFSVELYEAQLEEKVKTLVEGIAGVGQAQVMVTLQNSTEYIYQSDVKSTEDASEDQTGEQSLRQELQQEVVMVEGDNGKKQALLITERMPAVQGIVVVCDGAEDSTVEQNILEALTTAFGLRASKVCVIPSTS